MPPKAAAAPVPESVLKKQAATKKSAEDRAKAQATRKQVRCAAKLACRCCVYVPLLFFARCDAVLLLFRVLHVVPLSFSAYHAFTRHHMNDDISRN